jgi:hypothetical protein
MKKQMILFSTPNSGSDWFASAICKGDPEKKYFREFFNPITNDKYIDELSTGFGCEFISTYKNIAQLDKKICDEIYEKTWKKEKFNFTKENYSVFKIPFFVEKFDCIALTRKIENSFPPTRRNQVFWWYDCIYNSMLWNFDVLPKKTKKMIEVSEKTLNTIEHKILMCNYIYQETLIDYCNEYEIPIIQWENLMNKEVMGELNKIPSFCNLDLKSMKNWILETKEYKQKNFNKYKFDPKIHIKKYQQIL